MTTMEMVEFFLVNDVAEAQRMVEVARAVTVFKDPEMSCPCVTEHRPTLTIAHWHHVLPLSWGGPDTADNRQLMCPNTHYGLHLLLNALRRYRGDVPWEYRRRFGPYARRMAEEGYERWIATQGG